VRKWLRLRYALIPYILEQARRCLRSGLPMFRAMIFHHQNDPRCWEIDDQYYFGDSFLVAPVLDAGGVRDVYLPDGQWVDLWTGRTMRGPVWLKRVRSPLGRMPVYAVRGATIRVYPQRVECTDEMDLKRAASLSFDRRFRGLGKSILGRVTGLL
jgi:alpha-D-xyloside xylohydrolase